MAYATVEDVETRLMKTLSESEQAVCEALLDDVALLIDNMNENAAADVKKAVSCRAVARIMSSGANDSIPIGASQGSMQALGYAQSWSMGSSGAIGELYLTKAEKQMLGIGSKIGSHSPVEDFCVEVGS